MFYVEYVFVFLLLIPSVECYRYFKSKPILPLRREVDRRLHHGLSPLCIQYRGYNNHRLLTSTSSSNFVDTTERLQVVKEVLQNIIDADAGDDIISSGIVTGVNIDENGCINLSLTVRNINSPLNDELKNECRSNLELLDWVTEVKINISSSKVINIEQADIKRSIGGLSLVKNIIAVSSCKGGVGKSTVSVNLAYTLQKKGFKVGILDADIYGPSLPTMTKPPSTDVKFGVSNQLTPINFLGVSLMSMGFLNKGAAIMRGPMVNQILTQFVTLTDWGELDYLVLDMPPGTGDIQLTLAQIMNISCAVVVTTPQRLSFVDVVKGIDLFDTVNIPCVAVVENMADYDSYSFADEFYSSLTKTLLSQGSTNNENSLNKILRNAIESQKKPRRMFGDGHTRKLKEMWGMDNLVSIPLLEELSACADAGIPYVMANPQSLVSDRMNDLADRVLSELARLSASTSSQTVTYDEKLNEILFEDSKLNPVEVRADCRCAVCVEEFTGRALLDRASIPLDIKPLAMAPIGRYATSIDWSDGHKSLIPFRQLSNLKK